MRANIATTDYAKPNENVNFCRRQRYSTEMVKFVACVDQVSRIFFPRISALEVADDRERLAVRVIKTQLCIFSSILSNGFTSRTKTSFLQQEDDHFLRHKPLNCHLALMLAS